MYETIIKYLESCLLFVISDYNFSFDNYTHDIFPDIFHSYFIITTKTINRFIVYQLPSMPTGKVSTIDFVCLSLNMGT
jgi:hypothetical protein